MAKSLIRTAVAGADRRNIEREARRDLRLLEAVAEDGRISQRSLATKLGIALGLANLYLKRLVHKGYIKCVNIQSNRIMYLLTPKGIAEKTRLTYEFMDYSLHLYRGVRKHLQTVLEPYTHDRGKVVVLYGTGEAAELAYLSLKEMGLEPAAIFDGGRNGVFLGMPVRSLHEHEGVRYDLMIVATLERPDVLAALLVNQGIPREKLVFLREMPEVRTAP